MNKLTLTLKRFYKSRDKYVFYSISIALLSGFIILGLFLINYSSLPKEVPLLYSLPWGKPQLVDLNQFILLPGIVLLTTLINLIISWHLHTSQLILKRILAFTSATIGITLLITAWKVIAIFI